MSLIEVVRTAIGTLAASPLRSSLTALGIAIGAATTLVVVILGHGARDLLEERLVSAGKNLIIIRPGAFTADGFVPKAPLTQDDAQRLRKCSLLNQLTTGVAEAQVILETVRAGRNEVASTVSGVHPDAFRIRDWSLASGRFLSQHDSSTLAPVCVLGNTVKQALFPERSVSNIIGQKITLRSIRLTVVGVLNPRGKDPLGRDHDDEVFIPLNLIQARLTHSTDMTIMIAAARTSDDITPAVNQIRLLLRSQHHLRPDDLDDCDVTTVQEMAAIGIFTVSTLNLLTIILAAFCLAVGAVGVMATMLVTIGEKTREIGLRICIGALPQDIRSQLVVEAIIITVGGGIVGITTGIFLAQAFSLALEWPFSVTLAYPVIGFTLLIIIGIIAGIYPGLRAGRMNPISAIHAE